MVPLLNKHYWSEGSLRGEKTNLEVWKKFLTRWNQAPFYYLSKRVSRKAIFLTFQLFQVTVLQPLIYSMIMNNSSFDSPRLYIFALNFKKGCSTLRCIIFIQNASILHHKLQVQFSCKPLTVDYAPLHSRRPTDFFSFTLMAHRFTPTW